MPKPETAKPEVVKPEASKPEVPKPEPPKAETKKPHGPRPALILLGGAVNTPLEDSILADAEGKLAARGYFVQILHYAGAGDKRADFTEWMRQLGDAITQLRTTPDIDSTKIGLIGVNAGAALALHRAQGDPRVKAVVEYYGVYRVRDPANASHLPPTLIVGNQSEAQHLDALLTQYHVPHERITGQQAGDQVVEFLRQYLPPT